MSSSTFSLPPQSVPVEPAQGKHSAAAFTDALTGLRNRRALDEALQQEWDRLLRRRSQGSFLLLELDGTQRIAQMHGHACAQECLAVAARVIRPVAKRAADTVARFNDTQLAMLLPGTNAEGAAVVALAVQRQMQGMSVPHRLRGAVRQITCSVGCVTLLARADSGDVHQVANLLTAANVALYRAQTESSNRIASTTMLLSAAGHGRTTPRQVVHR